MASALTAEQGASFHATPCGFLKGILAVCVVVLGLMWGTVTATLARSEATANAAFDRSINNTKDVAVTRAEMAHMARMIDEIHARIVKQ